MSKKTIGGQRLGAGGAMKVELHNYGRSTHNLSRAWRSTIAPGVLVPCLVEPTLRGDTWDIDIASIVKTLPALGPLFGEFKMQIDVFEAEVRLYHRYLHNNRREIGLNMKEIMFPKIIVRGPNVNVPEITPSQEQISSSSLLHYLGVTGLGYSPENEGDETYVQRAINAVPLLMYYEIFANYYANQQEENAYVINTATYETGGTFDEIQIEDFGAPRENFTGNADFMVKYPSGRQVGVGSQLAFIAEGANEPDFYNHIGVRINGSQTAVSINDIASFLVTGLGHVTFVVVNGAVEVINEFIAPGVELRKMELMEFPLENIYKMRDNLMEAPASAPYYIEESLNTGTQANWPYSAINGVSATTANTCASAGPMAGLMVKTYQSDKFNNWLNSDYIDGVAGITKMSEIDVSSGVLTIDDLNLQQKIYNILNRIVVSGGTYYDWEDAVYGEEGGHPNETPLYRGSLMSDVVFSEIVSGTDVTDAMTGEVNPLGTLAGRGHETSNRSGRIRIKCNHAGYIMAIVSLTPKIDYSQGNKWWTRLSNMDELHKPELDGIGWQELVTDEMAAWSTPLAVRATGAPFNTPNYQGVGKQPAWIDYMTSYNECHGEFANKRSQMYMTLNRQYERDEDTMGIRDLTTYIDPQKYNYAFAKQTLDAQNFWVQIGFGVTARRKMSAKVIPNL